MQLLLECTLQIISSIVLPDEDMLLCEMVVSIRNELGNSVLQG